MLNRTVKAWVGGCSRQALLVIGLYLASMVCMGTLSLVIALAPIPGLSPDDRALVIALGLGVFLLTALAGTLVWGIGQIQKRAKSLDQAFIPLGLQGSMYLTNGRQYHGQYGGRKLDITFSRGPLLDVHLETRVKTRLGFAYKNRLGATISQWSQMEEMLVAEEGEKLLAAYTKDPDWARSLLDEPDAKALIECLMAPVGGYDVPQVLFIPDEVRLLVQYIPTEQITPEFVQTRLRDLVRLVQMAEALPPPTVPAELTRLEKAVHDNPSGLGWKVFLGIMGFILLSIVCVVAAFVILLRVGGVHFNLGASYRQPASVPQSGRS